MDKNFNLTETEELHIRHDVDSAYIGAVENLMRIRFSYKVLNNNHIKNIDEILDSLKPLFKANQECIANIGNEDFNNEEFNKKARAALRENRRMKSELETLREQNAKLLSNRKESSS